jgi:hypothetical protein
MTGFLPALARGALGMVARLGHADLIPAPRAVATLTCVGPGDAERERYLALLAEAEKHDRAGRACAADRLREQAEALLAERWRATWRNVVTTAGKNSLGEVYFRSGTQITAWYLGLLGAPGVGSFAVAASDTMASHAGWAEITAYSETTRRALTLGAFSAGAADNSGSLATFTMNASYTVKGLFTVSVSTKSGTTGALYNAVASGGGDRSGGSGDTLTGSMQLGWT